ncbi:MAG: hypothetical protein LUD68_02890 [Rikenellaceae bacterium]|nr:hypothetical protein [Rikenellaceae bacterium]
MMKKNLLYLLMFSFVAGLSSCSSSSNDDPTPGVPDKEAKLVDKIEYKSYYNGRVDWSTQFRFSYDKNRQVTKIVCTGDNDMVIDFDYGSNSVKVSMNGESFFSDYNYENDFTGSAPNSRSAGRAFRHSEKSSRKSAFTRADNSSSSYSAEFNYTLNSNGYVTSMTGEESYSNSYYTGTFSNRSTYKYANGYLESSVISWEEFEKDYSYSDSYQYAFHWDNGNLVKVVEDNNYFTALTYSTYENNNINIDLNLLITEMDEFLAFGIDANTPLKWFGFFGKSSSNLVSTTTETYPGQSYPSTYKYTQNEEGYITKVEIPEWDLEYVISYQ